MAKLVTQIGGWKYDPDRCPADKDFVDYMKTEQLKNNTVFMMGPGLHHLVGRMLLHDNVLAVTCSTEEMEEYMKLAIGDPYMARRYQCMFGDIYLANDKLLPADMNIVYLPHIGEMPSDSRLDYQAMSDEQLLEKMCWNLTHPGLLVGYNKSSAWDRLEPIFKSVAASNGMRFLHRYKSLDVWIRPI